MDRKLQQMRNGLEAADKRATVAESRVRQLEREVKAAKFSE